MKGHIEQWSPGSWRLYYDLPSDGRGKRQQRKETVRGTKREAERVLRERSAAIEEGAYVDKNKETVAQFMKSWLEGYARAHVSALSLQGYQSWVRCYIIPFLGSVRMQKLTPGTSGICMPG